MDGGLYPDLQSCGLLLASLIELKASDIVWEAGGCVVEDLRRFLSVAPWLSRLDTWFWILEELWGRLRVDGRVEEMGGCEMSGCLMGCGGWKDRCEYRGGRW